MTAYSPYQAYPGPVPVLSTPPPIMVAVADPAPQRRVTVFFRLLLAIPHLFVLYWLVFAAEFVAFIGWWGALFTGRLPEFAVTYLSGVLRWSARVYAYCCLLTDVYPPFTFDDDPAYPARVAIPEPQRLNRAAVFFRLFLAIPVGIVSEVVMYGAGTLMAFVAWLIVLVTGKLPPSLHLAYVAAIRFMTRYYGYFSMLTPAYPDGLYGDAPGTVVWADQPPAAETQGFGSPQGYGAPPGYGASGYGASAGYGVPAPGYGAPAGYGVPGGYGVRPVFQPASWRLTLTSAAKGLITTFIAIGSLVALGSVVLNFVVGNSTANSASNTAKATAAFEQLYISYGTLAKGLNTWSQGVGSCHQMLSCMAKEDVEGAAAYGTFAAQVAAIQVPDGATADKARLIAAATTVQRDLMQLSKSTSASQYNSTIAVDGLPQRLNTVDKDTTTLTNSLQDQASS